MDPQNMTAEQIADAVQWSNLAKKVLGNKATKGAFEKLVKQVAPEVETSEDLAEPLLSPMRDELKALRAELGGIREAGAEWNKQESIKALSNAGYTDEGIAKIQEIATAKGLKDLNDAAAIFDKTNPVAKTKVSGVSSQNFGNDIFGLQGEQTKEKLDLLFNDPDAFMAAEVNAVAAEYANNQE